MKKTVPATIIIDGVEMTVIDAVTKKQLVRIIHEKCKCPCHYEFDKVIICADCPCRNVTKEEWEKS